MPKSGGSSVHAALEGTLPRGSLAPRRFDRSTFADFHDFELLSKDARALVALGRDEVLSLGQYRAVSGHFSLTTLLQVADATSIATVLREPRARLLSLYMYWRIPDIGDFWAPNRVTDHARRPLSEFLSEPRLARVVDNQVCRMLLYGDVRLPESGFAARGDIESLAADAIEQLNELGFVGVLELSDSLWPGLARLFELELDPATVNVTEDLGDLFATRPGDQLLTAEIFELIEQRSAADLLIYEHALARAGLDARERARLSNGSFARELVKLGDLLGRSATRTAEQAGLVEVLRSQAEEERERSQAALEKSHARLLAYERTIQGHEETIHAHERTIEEHERTIHVLNAEVTRREDDLDRLRRWLDAVHASASWRLTTPLRAAKHAIQDLQPAPPASAVRVRDQSLLAGWSVNQVWWFALMLCSTIAATDAILSQVVLVAVLTAGPFCGTFTGRWVKTASVGIWAIVLAVPLGVADNIWDTATQFVDLGAVAIVALLSTLAAVFIERGRHQQLG